MRLDEYLEHLTDNNWHTLRWLIELERETIENKRTEELADRAYLLAKNFMTREN